MSFLYLAFSCKQEPLFILLFPHSPLRGGGGGLSSPRTASHEIQKRQCFLLLLFLISTDLLHITLSVSDVFYRASSRAFQQVIDSYTGASAIAQYWLLLAHLKKNDLPAAMVCNDLKQYTCLCNLYWKHVDVPFFHQ